MTETLEAAVQAADGGRLPQPYQYSHHPLVEPDWRRFPGWKDVTVDDWRSAQWQRSHCVKNVGQLKAVLGDLVDERFFADLEADRAGRHDVDAGAAADGQHHGPRCRALRSWSLTEAFYADPIRRYMLPVLSDRRTDWTSHPHATRDSLHEHECGPSRG